MITIKPAAETETLKAYLDKHDDGLIFLKASDKDELLGAGAATPEGEIVAVKSEIPMLNDGIIKSFINFFDRRNIKSLYSYNIKLFPDLKKVGFTQVSDKYTLNIDEFFSNHCKN
jgi:hypothetical protein